MQAKQEVKRDLFTAITRLAIHLTVMILFVMGFIGGINFFFGLAIPITAKSVLGGTFLTLMYHMMYRRK